MFKKTDFGMSAYVWWYIRRNYGLINENGYVAKRGYIVSQYARFIRPGFYRVSATSNPQALVFVTAYKGESKVIIVAINQDDSGIDQTFIIHDGTVKTFRTYTTSSTSNCVQKYIIPISNGSFTYRLDSSSITTFVSD